MVGQLGTETVALVVTVTGELDTDFDPSDNLQVRSASAVLGNLLQACSLLRVLLGQLTNPRRELVELGLVELVHDSVDKLAITAAPAEEIVFLPNSLKGYSLGLLSTTTDQIRSLIQGASASESLSVRTEAFILGLPSGDPSNSLLAPILAHEIGHILIDSRIESPLDNILVEVESVVQTLSSAQGIDDAVKVESFKRTIYAWLTESLCDMIACRIAGPSYLFASTVYLQAPLARPLSASHPPTPMRIMTCVNSLDRWGWAPVLAPRCADYVRQIADEATRTEVPPATPLTFYRSISNDFYEDLAGLAETHSGPALEPSAYEECAARHELEDSMSLRLMPPNLADEAPSPWCVLNAAWFARLNEITDVSDLSLAASDTTYNRFITKALELAGIASLWENNVDSSSRRA